MLIAFIRFSFFFFSFLFLLFLIQAIIHTLTVEPALWCNIFCFKIRFQFSIMVYKRSKKRLWLISVSDVCIVLSKFFTLFSFFFIISFSIHYFFSATLFHFSFSPQIIYSIIFPFSSLRTLNVQRILFFSS